MFLYLKMTRLERLEKDLAKLNECKKAALAKKDFFWLTKNGKKIKRLEEEIAAAKMREPIKLSEALSKDDMVRDDIYRKLLKCSLAADFINDCSEEVKSALKKHGFTDFHFREDIDRICELSQKIASLVIIPKQTCLTDMIVNNDEFIETCHAAANKHLSETLML